MTDFLVAALQITSTSNVEANFAEAEEQIELASRRGAELIGLPENFAFLGDDDQKLKLASELSIKCSNFLKTMSQRYQVYLLGGGYPVPAGDDTHTLNRSVLFGRDGQVLGKYDKIHLFGFYWKDHWQILLQARAIENTVYIVAPAQTGIHYGRRQSHGHAMVIDPWGTVLSDAGKTQGAAIAPADKERVKKVREQMPSLKHRKSKLFAN